MFLLVRLGWNSDGHGACRYFASFRSVVRDRIAEGLLRAHDIIATT